MADKSLTANQRKVLVFLFEQKDHEKESSLNEIADGTGLNESACSEALRELQEAGYIGGSAMDLLASSMDALKELDPEFNPTSRGYAEHIILIASAISQANESFLASQLSYDPEFVGLVGSRLRNAGIWKENSLAPARFKEWEKSGISFFLDGAVATGDLMVVGFENGEPQCQMTSGGKSHVEKLLKR